jgi:uncharacterized protein YndB with AHSA1/START domain
MTTIAVSTVIDAPIERVWDDVRDLASHVEWMADAEAIRFTSRRTEGVGTTFDCDTRIGPFRLTDQMAITRWKPRRRMGVRHVGVVTGSGQFTLKALRGGRTRFTWKERLEFPWWMGGPLGAVAGSPVLRWVWSRNLRRLKRLVEGR